MSEIVAAIPNYNMASHLSRLLPELLEQGYDRVYVMDDSSSDDSRQIVHDIGKDVRFIDSEVNTGAGGARNRVLPYCSDDTIIHFLDADVTTASQNNPEIIREIMNDADDTAFIGGLVKDKNGHQSIWNYGPRQSLYAAISAVATHAVSAAPDAVSKRLHRLTPNRPNPFEDALPCRAHWTLEANLVIQAKRLKELGGFDEAIREHDIQPLAAKARKLGLKVLFNPLLEVQHLDGEVRSYNRNLARWRAEMYVASKYGGRLNWWLPDWLIDKPVGPSQADKNTP